MAHFKHLMLGGLAVLVSTTIGAQQSVTRSTAFDYHPTTGLLTLERVDPGGTHCVETEYRHDAYGNREKIFTRPCSSTTASFPTRVTVNEFAASTDGANPHPAGAFQTRTYTGPDELAANRLVEASAAYDARFGTARQQTEVAIGDATKSVAKKIEYDGFGRVFREYTPVKRNADNSVVEVYVEHAYNNYCVGPKKPATASGACLNFTATVPVSYASKRLAAADGSEATSALVEFKTAYFVESTPYSGTGPSRVVIGAKSRVHYDSLHREIAKETQAYDGRWVRTLTGYDALGQVAASWGAHFVADNSGTLAPPSELRQWTASRDMLHRPTDQRRYWKGAEGSAYQQLIAQVTYNGLESTAIVPAGSSPNGVERRVITRKNPAGQTAQTVNAEGATLNMAYDPMGNLVETRDPLGHAATVTYTPGTARFKTGMTDPDQGSWSYTYDALGQLKTQTDARGKTISMTYDVLGRLLTKNTDDLQTSHFHGKNEAGAYCAYGLNRPCESKSGLPGDPVTRQAQGYDTLGRPVSTTTTLDRVYVSSSTFDDLGRVASTTYPTGFRVNYGYSTGTNGKVPGVLETVSDHANASRVFWRIDTLTANQVFDAQGHLLKARLGNDVVTDNKFDPVSGQAYYLSGVRTTTSTTVYGQTYTYDKAGNLASRSESMSGASETFAYDVLDRLTRHVVTVTANVNDSHTTDITYNAIGNVIAKSNVGGYVYTLSNKPHAVRSAGGTNYDYDANGNVLSTTGAQARSHAWTDFNHPASLSYQGKSVTFKYDASYKRVKEVTTNGATVRTLFLIHPDNAGGLGYEREETKVSGTLTRNENRHYISVGGAVVAVVKTLNSGDPVSGLLNGSVSSDPMLTQYWHKDSLGSIVAVSDAAGTIERMAFDAWGRRQRDTGRVDPWVDPAHGNRGYTGHEHLDELALVHMNGRVYDPLLARFLSADPILQSPGDLQNYNRYSYVLNNPLKYTDPTGQCFGFLGGIDTAICGFMIVGAGAMAVSGNKYWSLIGQLTLAYALQGLVDVGLGSPGVSPFGPMPQNAFNVGGFGNSFIAATGTSLVASGGDLAQATQDGIFAGMTTLVGRTRSEPLKVLGHAVIGCARGSMTGGKCGPSASAAAFSKIASTSLNDLPPGAHVAATVVAGGTASVIGGGKFVNGAAQASFTYLYNYLGTLQRGALLVQQAWGRLQMLAHSAPAQFALQVAAGEVGTILPNSAAAGNVAVDLLQRALQRGIPDVHDGVLRQLVYAGDDVVVLLRRDFGVFNHGRGDHYNLQVFGPNSKELSNIHYHVDSQSGVPQIAWDSKGAWNGGQVFNFSSQVPRSINSQ